MIEGIQHAIMDDSNQPNVPKLQLSPRRPAESAYPMFLNVEVEDISPLGENSERRSSEFIDLKPPAEAKLQHANPRLYQRRVLSDKPCNTAPLSPCPSLSQSDSNASSFKSPLPTDAASDISQCTVTPPAARAISVGVSSKRLGNDVRREHTKRRRPSPRVNKSDGGVNLWGGDTSPQASTGTEDDDFEFLFSNTQNVVTTKHYWELCYGKDTSMTISPGQSWSAKRVAPAKGCLSRRMEASSSPTAQFKTPPASPQKKSRHNKTKKNVQFGLPQAVEYEIDGPSRSLTVLPPDVAKARYPMEIKEETPVEEEMTQETKKNSALLAEWEEDFDEPKPRSRRNRKNRRSSSLFKPTPIKTSGEDSRHEVNDVLAPSPSAEVAASLSSLSMTSPKVALDNDVHGNAETLASSSTDEKDESPPQSQEQNEENDSAGPTTNGSSSLMDITPPQRALSHDSDDTSAGAETTPPPSSLGLETIHSVGGALDIDSPGSRKQMASHSPLPTMMNLCSSGENSKLERETVRKETVDITRILLRNPAEDQAWASADLLQNMAIRDERKLESMLLSIDPNQKHVVSNIDKLVVKANEIAEKMPKTKVNTEKEAQRVVHNEWMRLETVFLTQLNQGLERTLKDMASLSERAKNLQGVQCPKATKRAKRRSLAKSYIREIEELEKLVFREKQSLDFLEASSAPHAAISCQSTLAIMGFLFDEFNGEILQLSFEHVVQGTESTVIFDLREGSLKVQRTTGFETKQQSIPPDHVAAKLHHHMLNVLANGELPTFDASNLAELQDAIASVSKKLGEIDSMVAGLHVVAKDNTILVNADMPSLEVELPNGDCIVLHFGMGASLVPDYFTLFPGDGGTATRNTMADDITSHNLFQKLLERCKK